MATSLASLYTKNMLWVFITFALFSGIFIYFAPTPRSKAVGIAYLIVLFFLVWGVGGFVFRGKPSANELYVFYAFYIFLLGLHIPLILKLAQSDIKHAHIKSARKIFEGDVKHLTDAELHYRLKH